MSSALLVPIQVFVLGFIISLFMAMLIKVILVGIQWCTLRKEKVSSEQAK